MPRTKSTASRKDPAGGLTAAGREYFRRKEGAHLRPALAAHAWGEPVPKTKAAAAKLAAKGTRLLERYKAAKARR